jgi:hypothetical protein
MRRKPSCSLSIVPACLTLFQWAAASGGLDLDMGESPRLTGLAAARLAADPAAMDGRSGSVQADAHSHGRQIGPTAPPPPPQHSIDASPPQPPFPHRPRRLRAHAAQVLNICVPLASKVVAELAAALRFDDGAPPPPSIRSLRFLLPNFVFPAIERQQGRPVPRWVRTAVPNWLLPWAVFAGGPPPAPDGGR